MYSCEFLLAHYADCGSPATHAVSARHPMSDDWRAWPVCDRHAAPLSAELISIGFVATPGYPIGDLALRSALESAA